MPVDKVRARIARVLKAMKHEGSSMRMRDGSDNDLQWSTGRLVNNLRFVVNPAGMRLVAGSVAPPPVAELNNDVFLEPVGDDAQTTHE